MNTIAPFKKTSLDPVYGITEKEKAELKAQAALAFADSVVDDVRQPILILDQELEIIRANRCFKTTFRIDSEEYNRFPLHILRGGEWNVQGLPERLRDVVNGGEEFEDLEISAEFREIGIRTLLLSANRINPELSQKPHLLLNIEDVTERRKIKHTLQRAKDSADQSNRAKTAFLANMSHEIRTPLTVIIGYAEMLSDRSTPRLEQIELAERIGSSAKQLKDLVDTILDLSKIEAGKMELERVVFPLKEQVEEVFRVMADQARAKNLEFSVQYDSSIPCRIQTDPTRLRQILTNVLGNAVKFTREGKIAVHLRRNGKLLCISVQDTGRGLTPEQSARIFAPFVQADSSTTRVFGGTGLGLALSRRLARLLGGDLSLKESQPGQGSTFEITLDPGDIAFIEEKSPEIKLDGDLAQVSLKGMRILIVEDNDIIRELVKSILDNMEAVTDVAKNGRECVLLARTQCYDLILMDLHMPEMNGYEATVELRRQRCKTPVVALSARQVANEREKMENAGFSGCLAKPFLIEDLVALIGKFYQPAPPRPTSGDMPDAPA